MFHPPPPPLEVMPAAPVVAACASGVLGALLLRVSLHCCLCHWDGVSLHPIQGLSDGRLWLSGEWGTEVGNRGLVSLLLLDYQAHGCCSWGPEFWCLRGRRDKATGQAAAIQFLWPRTPPKPGGLCCVGCLPWSYWTSWGCGYICHNWRSGIAGTPSSIPLISLPCVSQSTHLQVCRLVEFSSILECWAESPLSSCGYFTGCRWKRREKGSNSSCHYSDRSLQFSSLLSWGCRWEQGLIWEQVFLCM